MKDYLEYLSRCLRHAFIGSWTYYTWMMALTAVSLVGLHSYCKQFAAGLVVTGMTDEVSWGIYIANFTYLVGMAAAAVMLVIPVYLYKDNCLKHVVLIGELLAVSAIIMCLLFVMVDLGRPDRFWHLIPLIGRFHWPMSMLTWDVIVLNGYLLLNVWICGYSIYMVYRDRKPTPAFYLPVVFVSIGWAFSIHTVTAFLYVGLGGRPYWNESLVAARFLASAFSSGPSFIILTLQLLREKTHHGHDIGVDDRAMLRLRSIVQVAMLINLFLLFCELFKEFYTDNVHTASVAYLYFGLKHHHALVGWIWTSMVFQSVAMFLLLHPISGRRLNYLYLASALCVMGIWMEKGMGLIVPGFIPTPLGDVVEYHPTLDEWLVSFGIWAFGAMCYTIFLKMTLPVLTGLVRYSNRPGATVE
ncbi:MAG: NrfD/PsrC family molybdoenzyme membrane anchor subunit [Vulcanimicrobiota bacterium]